MLVPEPDDLRQFLECDDVVDWRHPAILETSRHLTGGLTDDVSKAEALFEWVRDTVPHSRDAGREEVTCSASEVLTAGTGICYGKAHLLAALLRSVGIPAGFCYQVYYEPLHKSPQRLALHGLNGIYLESVGKWVRVDPRGNKPGVNAQFSIEKEQLALPEDEFLDNQVYAKPLSNVVEALRSHSRRTDLWPHLPGPPKDLRSNQSHDR